MAKSKPKLEQPVPKISATFLHFAEPLLEILGPAATQRQMQEPLQLAFTVWNAVVYADAAGNRYFLDALRDLTGSDQQMAAFVSGLIVRKRSLFGDDHRLIGEYKLSCQDGEIRLWAEARDPHTPA